MRANRRGRSVDVHHACRGVGELIRRAHLLLLRFHEGRLPQRPGEPDEQDACFDILVSCVSIVPCETPVALECNFLSCHSAKTRSEIAGQTPSAQSPKSRSVSTTSASSASGSAQINVPVWPKWPNVRAELRAPVQCGDFESLISKPSPQSLGRCTPYPGSTPSRPGNCTVVASACNCAETVDGRSNSPAKTARSETVEVAPNPAAALPPFSRVAAMPSGWHTASA